ncbi:MAG: hypothetical protein PHX43_03050 [Alphaproteobacteria bacterium]|nr:hypothetical protein [Alphaproteobacteria bacterium]
MKYALYEIAPGVTKKILLKELVHTVGSTDPKKLSASGIRCPDCGAQVHVYDVLGALGFKTASKETTRKVGFHHADHMAGENCPSAYDKNDPRYLDIRANNSFNIDAKRQIEKILLSPEIRANNLKVLGFFIGEADLTHERLACIDKFSEKKLYHMEALEHMPWMLPYMQVIMEGHFDFTFDSGITRKITYVGDKKVSWEFYSDGGEIYSISSPRILKKCFVNKNGSLTQLVNPSSKKPVEYEISKAGWEQLVKMDRPAPAFSRQASYILGNKPPNKKATRTPQFVQGALLFQ